MLKHLKIAAIALLTAVAFTACTDDETSDSTSPAPAPEVVRGQNGFYVINQGNSYSQIASTLSFVAGDSVTFNNVFYNANNKSIGDNAQKPVIYGAKMYIPMHDENLVWVVNAETCQEIARIEVKAPQAVAASSGYVFVSNSDSLVTRVDTTGFAKTDLQLDGSGVYGMTSAKGNVYVNMSGKYGTWEGGSKVAKIDAATLSTTYIAVGINPYDQITSDDAGNVFTVCCGNYADVASQVWKINAATGTASKFCDGTHIAVNNQNRTSRETAAVQPIYVINQVTDWNTYATVCTCKLYNTATGEVVNENFLPADHQPALGAIVNLDVNPATGDLYICADNKSYDYSSPGTVWQYKADGTYVKIHRVGIHPYGVAFK